MFTLWQNAIFAISNDEDRGQWRSLYSGIPTLVFAFNMLSESSFVLFFIMEGYYRRIKRPVAELGANQLTSFEGRNVIQIEGG